MYLIFGFFFFKQKTAYEMRISDWSSDVCSSDLRKAPPLVSGEGGRLPSGGPRPTSLERKPAMRRARGRRQTSGAMDSPDRSLWRTPESGHLASDLRNLVEDR